jgi:hypothetical protein
MADHALKDPDLTGVMPTRLGDMFPHDAHHSPWLYRLAVLHDDIRFELAELLLEPDAPDIAAWKTSYFLRRLSISIDEARHIWVKHVVNYLEEHRKRIPSEVDDRLIAAGKLLVETADKLRPVRNAVGAHVRPSNARPKEAGNGPQLSGEEAAEAFEREALRSFDDWEGPAQMSAVDVFDSTYRGLTITSAMFAVGTRDLEALRKWHTELRLIECCYTILNAIDLLIYLHVDARRHIEEQVQRSKAEGTLLSDEGKGE